ncbi:TonB-dependent receptor plug domain-containing protein [Marinibactrum halimedae]|uniref:Ligand-gated channel n=1 Tax=Marinibactrum halimedae TaxID=1444977 RepID=A0AA37T6B1_9GAMM|nr:TonB-dependent receptor [Marinibactrum halimedae]MCD9459367.1 TonB-dependent receptor [Marinibactrum halimedae]GLS27569.1 ligand-gated channel [Marinibactrum halimedae]
MTFNKTALASLCVLASAATVTTTTTASDLNSASNSASNDKREKLEEVIVISNRVKTPLFQVGSDVSVVSFDDIQHRGQQNLAEVLRTQAGIGVSNLGGIGKQTSVRVRGEEGFRTQMRVDGVKIANVSAPQVSPLFDDLLSVNVERVEILRGPQGMVYGADAGGVVSVTTLEPSAGFVGNVGVEAGSFGTHQVSSGVSFGDERGGVVISGARIKTDGFNARTIDTEGEKDGYDNTTVHLKAKYEVADGLTLRSVYRSVEADNEYDSCFAADFSPSMTCRTENNYTVANVGADYESDTFTQSLSITQSTFESDYATNGQRSFTLESKLDRVEYNGSLSFSDSVKAIYGVDFEAEDASRSDLEREQWGAYALLETNINDQWFFSAGARNDSTHRFGDFDSYRLTGAFVQEFGAGTLKFRSSYGTGFRAPSLSEQAYNLGVFAFGETAGVILEEETSEGYDVGIDWFGENSLIIQATYFDQTIENEINGIFAFNPAFGSTSFAGYVNGDGESESRGVEVSTSFALSGSFNVWGNATYNDTETSLGLQRVRRPEWMVNAGLTWRGFGDRFTVSPSARWVANREGLIEDTLDDYAVLDLTASVEVVRNLEVYGRVENLTDREFVEAAGFNTAGRGAYAGVRYSFD